MYAGFFAAVLVMVLIDMFALNRAGNPQGQRARGAGLVGGVVCHCHAVQRLAVVDFLRRRRSGLDRPPARRWPIRKRWNS